MPVEKSRYMSDVWKDNLFVNKVVFCTGGAGTICSAQVRAMVHLGANACIVGRRVEKTEQVARDLETARSGARVLGIGNVDVRNVKSLEDAVERCVKELGGIDFVIAGAAGNFLAPLTQLSANAFKSVIDIDLLGSYNTFKATFPHLAESAARCKSDGKTASANGTGGRIIFISATFHYTGFPLQTHASTAKAGVDALSANIAIECGPRGITSNIIAPGPIEETEGMERLSQGEQREAGKKIIPLGRWGWVKEIADATIFLFSDAGNFVNGDVMVVDGGAWRNTGAGTTGAWAYPDFLLADQAVTGVKGGKGSKTSKL